MLFSQKLLQWSLKIFKFFLHWITGKSEIERIVSKPFSANLITNVYLSLSLSTKLANECNRLLFPPANPSNSSSSSPSSSVVAAASATQSTPVTRPISEIVSDFKRQSTTQEPFEPVGELIAKKKQFPLGPNRPFYSLQRSLRAIYGTNLWLCYFESLRSTPYQTEVHSTKLTKLWNALYPEQQLKGLVSEQWKDIGFQGDDPSTDFRGMGILGLENLVYLATQHPDLAQSIVATSQHPTHWFPFAITGIHITKIILDMLRSGSVRHRFYEEIEQNPKLKKPVAFGQGGGENEDQQQAKSLIKVEPSEDFLLLGLNFFNELYSLAFQRLRKQWVDEKAMVTEFPFFKERFHKELTLLFTQTSPLVFCLDSKL